MTLFLAAPTRDDDGLSEAKRMVALGVRLGTLAVMTAVAPGLFFCGEGNWAVILNEGTLGDPVVVSAIGASSAGSDFGCASSGAATGSDAAGVSEDSIGGESC